MRRAILLSAAALLPASALLRAEAPAPEPPVANRPKVPGTLKLTLRERRDDPAAPGRTRAVERTAEWQVAETAIIVCDMWDDHYCKSAAQRVELMVPAMNRVLAAARDHGVMIIYAPSETMNIYEGSPQRTRMQKAKFARPPVPIAKRCPPDDTREPAMPIDMSGCVCDDAIPGPVIRRHTRQHKGLDIFGFDGISDSGEEIYNYCEQEGIRNIVLMGVHTNFCILARPFGIRQMVRLGRNVVLARDLTDALYDPRRPPFVSHTRGTELVIEHIERWWCPSIAGADLTRVAPGSADPPAKSLTGPARN
jgi:nicotinamidase-related amidase